MGNIKSFIPDSLKMALKKAFFWGNKYFCPVCNSNVRLFYDFGLVLRHKVMCPVCGSLERHREVWLFFETNTNLFDSNQKSMLHIAPEPQFVRRLKKVINLKYITAELDNADATVMMDITNIPCNDNSFDVIYCSHVLEHVVDDRKAISELHRVLKPNGWAAIMVPTVGETTFEDKSLTNPLERKKFFGQKDHVRKYGRDFKDRLSTPGFLVNIINLIGSKKINATNTEYLFLCKK